MMLVSKNSCSCLRSAMATSPLTMYLPPGKGSLKTDFALETKTGLLQARDFALAPGVLEQRPDGLPGAPGRCRDALAARERIDGEAGHDRGRGLLCAAGADRRGTSCRRPRGEEPDKHATSLFEGTDDMTHTQDHHVS